MSSRHCRCIFSDYPWSRVIWQLRLAKMCQLSGSSLRWPNIRGTEPYTMSNSESESTFSAEIDVELRSLIHRFRDVLAMRSEALKCFADQGVQVEGWLKGELLAFLTQERLASRLVDFDREVLTGQGRRKADLTLNIQPGAEPGRAWIELKHFLIGIQKGIEYNAYGYFNDPTNGIKQDIDKLLAIPSPHRYVLILMTANPGPADWQLGIARFNEKFERRLRALTNPQDFPDHFFLGLLVIDQLAQTRPFGTPTSGVATILEATRTQSTVRGAEWT